MEIRNIESLTPNPNNDRVMKDEGKRLLLHAMSLGNHGSFLITPEGMIIDGNHRWLLRAEAEWSNKEVQCSILSFGQDAEGFYPIIDGEIVKFNEVIPHHYVSLEALYHAYAFTRNSEAAYYDPDAIANKFAEWELDSTQFQANFFPPKSIQDTLDAMAKQEAKKKYQLIIPCEDEADMDVKYQAVVDLGYKVKRKI